MIKLKRTNSDNLDFQSLVRELDKELAIRDGDEHAYYAQFNKIDAIKYVVVAYENDLPVGCGAIKAFDENSMEVKRMFVPLESRGKGVASIILRELEKWTAELGYERCVLETGYKQPEAIALYKKNGYIKIPNYGQYIGMNNSICFEKVLDAI
ncbi:MAG: GNAT family N-acetyltransferase [Acidobacteriota bacterium]